MILSHCSSSLINNLYKEKVIDIDLDDLNLEIEPDANEYLNIRGESNSCIARYLGNEQIKLVDPKLSIDDIKPKDLEQHCLIDSLLDPDIKIVIVNGPAGSGKTFLSVAYGIFEIMSYNGKKGKQDKTKEKSLILTKPTETVKNSKFFGAVPGGNEEKFAIFLDSYESVIKKIMKDVTYGDALKATGQIQYKPIEFCRGDNWDNTILILDEAQNLDWHSLKTVLTRLGENSKAILLGDITQKDVKPYEKSGIELLKYNDTFKDSSLTSVINLKQDYRGPISRLITSIAKEIED